MPDVCPTCGLPKEICVCGDIAHEQENIRVFLERILIVNEVFNDRKSF